LITEDRSAGTGTAARPAYGALAGTYERRTAAYDEWRRRLVALLPVRPGNVVLDVGCGTGLCFPRLQEKVGPAGRIVGIDESADMLDIARRHIAENGWENVTLVTAPADQAKIPTVGDAALFSAVHDILQSQPALDNVFAHLRTGAWVAAAGGKWARAGLLSLDPITYAVHEPYIRSFAGFDKPWRLLEPMLIDFTVTEVAFGTGYLAAGRVP
jgi:demethylmenaquinone methyltransferase/2-methoxy-6-polyprenyl-1,4-benzoquinol methylase